ncbi:TetR/AcrR family transcriptional regulator [Prauserella alba]|uniref:TetR/AcrR family transcriptional regulator n=1 Tax=Prauserella alba TaxID=176898 RepID=A0ABN1V6G4_9PSEU|nr:TetR/AcrR family transcriptional regulator [Prauserella alba]MCP2180094.1 transcriptional regulator, TetR family [Prauserella alba]
MQQQDTGSAPAAPPSRRRGDRRAQLARIAAELFCRRGYHAVGLGDIATEAGITGPAIYRHFKNKQAILTFAADDLAAATRDAVETALARATTDPWSRIDAIVRSLTALVIDRREGAQLYQWERRHLDPEDHARFTATMEWLVDTVAGLVGEGRPRLPEADRATVATAALSAIASLATHRTTVSARVAQRGLRSIALGVLATGLPPRLGGELAEESPVPPAASRFVSRRERLVVAALRPIRERGFHAVTMEELGAAAGIGGSSVYRHFASKAELLAAVYYRAADRLTVTTSTAIESAAEPGEALRALVDAYVDYNYSDSDLAAVYRSEHGNLPDDDRRQLRKVQREHVEQWVRLVMAVRGDTRATYARLAVHAALNIVHDLCIRRQRIADAGQIKHLVFAALAS